jgi:hypothetical protein
VTAVAAIAAMIVVTKSSDEDCGDHETLPRCLDDT